MAMFMRSTSAMCENCGVQQKFPGHHYCGKTCATEAARKNKTTQRIGVSGPPNPVVGSASLLEPGTSDLCENCYARPKSQETDDDGTVIIQPYCGVRCSLTSQRSILPASNIPSAPAAAPITRNPSSLLIEHARSPVGHNISEMMQERWKSDELGTPQLKSVYRIGLSNQVYRRFDLALQVNDGCTVTTTYYGGYATCNIANDKDPSPCGSESCEVCDVLCSSFGNAPYGASSRVGAYGTGLYTYKNPALAHRVAISDDDEQSQGANYVLIQCRVVLRENSGPGSKSFSASMDDSGVTFCAQSTAIIPTHLLIYRLNVAADTQHFTGAVNANLASINRTPAAPTPASVVLGQPKSSNNTGSSEIKVETVKGKGKARGFKGRFQGSQHQSSDSRSSLIYPSNQQETGGTRSDMQAPNQAVPTPPTLVYPPIPPSVLNPVSAATRGLLSTPAPNPETATLRALGILGPRGKFLLMQHCCLLQRCLWAPVAYPPAPPSVITPVSAANQGLLATPAPDPATAALRALNHVDPGVYPPVPASVLTPVSAANQGLLSAPAPDPATAALRAAMKPDTRASPPAARSSLPQDNYFNYLNSDETLARRQGLGNYDSGDDDPYAELPEHPPGHLPEHAPSHLPDLPPNRSRRPPRRRP